MVGSVSTHVNPRVSFLIKDYVLSPAVCFHILQSIPQKLGEALPLTSTVNNMLVLLVNIYFNHLVLRDCVLETLSVSGACIVLIPNDICE